MQEYEYDPWDHLAIGICIMGIIFSANSLIHFASLYPVMGQSAGDFGNKEEDIGMYVRDSKAGNHSLGSC